MIGHWFRGSSDRSELHKTLQRHFDGRPLGDIVTAARVFPITSRVDVQRALEQLFAAHPGATLLGVHSAVNHDTPSLAHIFTPGPFPLAAGPLQHDEVDVGDDLPARCLKNGLWLARAHDLPFALLLCPATRFGQTTGVQIDLGLPAGEPGARLSEALFRDLERRVGEGRAYRGRVISLEAQYDFRGHGGSVKVHRLHRVERDDVILPPATLALLDRNVARFVALRDRIKALRFSAKKGLLFHGPPGTGKTHTIHYLASQLPEHTTLLVTAEQVGLLSEYFRLARFLQPAMLVIEDVDLIARAREELAHPGQEMLLNKLLNEMDGLREDADVLCILTTNRPDQLEPALAARPGRIDQAIAFPLPDDEGRAKLVRLYARGLELSAPLLAVIVRRTQGASPAFIKELMRRSAQFQFEQGDDPRLRPAAVDAAIEELVFTGGALNVKLLGGSADLGAPTA